MNITFRLISNIPFKPFEHTNIAKQNLKYVLPNDVFEIQSARNIGKNVYKISEDIFDRTKIEKTLQSFGFSKDDGYLIASDELTSKIHDLQNIAGGSSSYALSQKDVDTLHKMITTGEHKDFWQKLDKEELFVYYERFKNLFAYSNPTIIESRGTKFWDEVLYNLEHKIPNEKEQTALNHFVGDCSDDINDVLTNLKKGKPTNNFYMEQASQLSKLIEKYPTTSDIKLERVERNIHRFSGIKLRDGTSLDEILNNFDKYRSNLAEINKELSGRTIDNERFMSATLRENNYPMQGIPWEINLKKGSKALFRGTYTNVNNHEAEYIIQKDSKIVLKGISLDFRERPILVADVIV